MLVVVWQLWRIHVGELIEIKCTHYYGPGLYRSERTNFKSSGFPGTGISEKEISSTFNESRTPVREAFLRLAQEGLVIVFLQAGKLLYL
ncbi:hypothetical protein DMO16_18770 [Fictibacillus sp. S7]|nr:hypothetical protein DMO16_18770 [Fictibacillus sp. S7]